MNDQNKIEKENILRENKIMRLKREKDFYIREIRKFEEDLNKLDKATDVYKKRLLVDQIDETKKALLMVNRRLLDFEEGGDM
ncbi:hypothetical protein P3W45_001301 [Vairimorpha bombi]